MSSATRIKDRFTCRHRGCRWGQLACGSSTSGPCFPGPCPCKRFNSIATKLKIDFVHTWVQLPTRGLGCQDPRSACPTKRLSKWWWWWWRRQRAQTQRKKLVDIFHTCWRAHIQHFQHRSPPVSGIIGRLQDGNFLEEMFAGFPTLSYSLDSQAELAMPLLPILGAAAVLFVLVEEEKSLFWVEKPLARFTSRPWPMLYFQKR